MSFNFVKKFKWTGHTRNLFFIILVCLVAFALTYPLLGKIPPHPDENQFNSNAFSIMRGNALANYLHVALTEYLLAAFFAIVNLFTMSGTNFPQGDPSLVTYYFGRVFGLIFYFLTFVLGCLVVQKGEKELKLRTAIFALLYFSSLGVFERFLRVNSDSMLVFVFINYVLVSLGLHKIRAPLYYFFLDNLFFLFLLSFSNFKALYLAIPLLVLNTVCPLIWYGEDERPSQIILPRFYSLASQAIFFVNVIFLAVTSVTKWSFLHLSLPVLVANSLNPYLWFRGLKKGQSRFGSRIYSLIIYGLGLSVGVVFLWALFMPQPFDAKRFWYQIKGTIIYGTQYDSEYPVQAYNSGQVYIYDLFVEYIGLGVLVAVAALVILAYGVVGKPLMSKFLGAFKARLRLDILKSGDLYPLTEIILFASLICYYLGVSLRVIHWSRWGIPLGVIALMLLSPFLEKLIFLVKPYLQKINPLAVFAGAVLLILVSWFPRLALTSDLATDNFPADGGHYQTRVDVEKLLKELNISPAEAAKKVAWFPGGPGGVGSLFPDKIIEPEYKDTKYILWPAWQIGVLYTDKNVDRSTSNQRAFIDKYVESVDYRFPSILARYTHATKYFAWKYLGLTYTPEIEALIEPQYAVVKLRDFTSPLAFTYTFGFNDMSHYYLPNSPIFNIKNLPDGYMFPPCYSNPAVAYVSTGKEVPEDPSTRSRTLGFNCHSIRLRVAFKGTYLFKIEGLPLDVDNSQMIYSAYQYKYDPVNRIIIFEAPQDIIGVEFGVATREKNIPDLKYLVYYESPSGTAVAK